MQIPYVTACSRPACRSDHYLVKISRMLSDIKGHQNKKQQKYDKTTITDKKVQHRLLKEEKPIDNPYEHLKQVIQQAAKKREMNLCQKRITFGGTTN